MNYETNHIAIDEIIMYLRKSRSDSPELTVEEVLARHEQELQEYMQQEFGTTLPEWQIYREVVSGETIADRPVMLKVMQLLESEQIKGILVIEPQRISRGDLEDCGKIINILRYTNTLVITPPKTYNLAEEYDRKFFEMELMRGNDYLEYTKRILNRGRLVSVKKGNYIGSVAPYGYQRITLGSGKNIRHTLEINPHEAETVNLIYQLYLEGYGYRKIAAYLDNNGILPRNTKYWSADVIRSILKNPVYIGKIVWNRRKTEKIIINGKIVKKRPRTENSSSCIYVDGIHQPIITEEVFMKVQNKLNNNPRIPKRKTLVNPYAGLLVCGTCGRAMSLKSYTSKRSKHPHVCQSMICGNQANCHTKSVQYASFEKRVIDSLQNVIENFKIQLENDDGSADKIQQKTIQLLQQELRKLKEKDARQKDAFDDGIYTKEEYLSRNAKVQEEIEEKKLALKHTSTITIPAIDYENKILQFTECVRMLQDQNESAFNKNDILKSCIEKIVYHNNSESKIGIGRFIENAFELELFLRF